MTENNNWLSRVSIFYLFRDSSVKAMLAMIFALVISLLALSVNYIFLQKSEYGNIIGENVRLMKEIDEKKRLSTVAAEYEKTSLVIGLIEEKLAAKFSQAELTRKFNTLARESHIDIISMNTRNGEVNSGYVSYVNEASFKANYPSIKQFLSSLDRLPGFNSVIELNLHKNKSQGKVSGTMVMISAKDAR